jgi:hypothetical protein
VVVPKKDGSTGCQILFAVFDQTLPHSLQHWLGLANHLISVRASSPTWPKMSTEKVYFNVLHHQQHDGLPINYSFDTSYML